MQLINYEKVCEKLGGRSRRTVERMVARGEFVQPIQVSPGRVMFVESDVDLWLESRRRQGGRRA